MLYPQIISCAYAESRVFQDSASSPQDEEIVVFKTQEIDLTESEKEKVENWLKARMKSNRIRVYYENQGGQTTIEKQPGPVDSDEL